MSEKKYTGYYNIESNSKESDTTIYIYGVIGGFDFDKWERINASDKFVDDFKQIDEEGKIIKVKINSPGGSIWDGLPIYNTLKNAKATIHTYVDGIAYSMASLIALSGDKVIGYNNSMLMFHNGSTFAQGNAQELRKEAEVLDNYDNALSSIIEEKLGITNAEVKQKYLNFSDNYFVGENAKEIGFFDEIISSNTDKVPGNIKEMSPSNLLKHYSALNFSSPQKPQTKPNNMSGTKKEFPTLQNALGMSQPFENTANVYLQEHQLQELENNLMANATALQTSKDATATMQTALDTATANLQTEKDNATAFYTGLANACKEQEIANYTDLSPSEQLNALNALVTEYGALPGAKKTAVATGKPKPLNSAAMPDYEKDAYALLGKPVE